MGAERIELTIRREGHPDMTVPLPSGSIHIGRAEDNGLVLPDIAVSRRHARLTISNGGVTIEDVGSGNGTYFEGKPIRKRELTNGDEILIDPFTLCFQIPNSEERESTDTATSEAEAGPPRVAGVARLVLVHGTGLRPEYPIRDGSLSMGRAEQRDVVLPDPAASRSHAEVIKQGDVWLLKDFGSINGTFVNSKRVREQVLQDGDRIRIGATEFRFEAPKAPSRAGAPAAPPAPPSPGTKPFENLIFGLEDGQKGLPEGLGTDRTFVPKGAANADKAAEPRAQLGAPPVPPRPADDPHFSTRKMPPTAAPAPPAPPAAFGAPPPAPPVASSPPAPPPGAAPPPRGATARGCRSPTRGSAELQRATSGVTACPAGRRAPPQPASGAAPGRRPPSQPASGTPSGRGPTPGRPPRTLRGRSPAAASRRGAAAAHRDPWCAPACPERLRGPAGPAPRRRGAATRS
jgi:pSer/pThr/pTyr-binding forkhead associated (FHA) protein